MAYGYYMPYQQNYQQPQNSFVHVQSENDARAYPVAPGASVTFINDNAPYCYTKTAGYTQFDAPTFRIFRLVEETPSEPQKCPSEALKENPPSDTFKGLQGEIEALRGRIEAIENSYRKDVAE